MCRFAGTCRYAFNRALATQKENYAKGIKFHSYNKMAAWLTRWRNDAETSWLKDGPSQAQQHALKNLENAFKRFFKKEGGFPKFKKKGDPESFRFPAGFQVDAGNARIKLPKLGWIQYQKSREIVGTPKNITISCKAGRWFVSIQTEREIELSIPPKGGAIGVDLGVSKFAALSNGQFLESPRALKTHLVRLRRAHRCLSRKKRRSKNRLKQKLKVQRLHARISNIRLDCLHKASHYLSKNHALVVIEDLKVRNLSRSAKGSLEKPGVNVKAKSGLNRSILDQGWGEFRRQLEYKCAWSGGILLKIAPHYTSQTCAQCGYCASDNRKTQECFRCTGCQHEDNADTNAAINILRAGLAQLACGEEIRPEGLDPRASSMKQEPTEGIKQTA
jgi:putative transposase